MEMTPAQHARVACEWSEIAGEEVGVERINGTVYAYGSELAVRRLAHKFRSFKVGWSVNLKTWYFSNDR